MKPNPKYNQWQNKQFRFMPGTFYHERFGDEVATVVRIGPILVHYRVKDTIYSMPLKNLDIVTEDHS